MQTMKIMTLRRNKKITQHANTGMHFYMQCRYPQTLRPTKITKKSILCYTLSKI